MVSRGPSSMPLWRKGLERRRWGPVLDMMIEHASLTVRAVESLRDAVVAMRSGDSGLAGEKLSEVAEAEERADALRREIMARLTGGVLPPLSRQDVIHLARRLDMVTDWAREASRFLSAIDFSWLPEEFAEELVSFAGVDVECVSTLSRAVSSVASDFDECMEACDRVEVLEREADRIYVDLHAKLVGVEGLSPGAAVVVSGFIRGLEGVADSSEDAVDVLRTIVIRARG